VGQGLCFIHLGLLSPILPLYLSSLGHTEFVVGLIVASFSVTGFALRPFIGYLADRWSVSGVLAIGGALIGVSGAALLWTWVATLALANALRGVGWAAISVGSNTMVAYIAPPNRRAETASYMNLFQGGISALVPPAGLWLVAQPFGSYQQVLLLSAGAGLAVALLSWGMGDPAGARSADPAWAASSSSDARGMDRFFDPGVWLASLMLCCFTFALPAMTTFIPLYGRTLGLSLEAIAWFYVASGATLLLSRAALGEVSDRVGRGPSLAAGFGCVALSLVMVAYASDLLWVVLAGIVHSVGATLHLPTSLALAIDSANPRRRGAAMASYSMWFQVGYGLGAAVAGALAEWAGYRLMFLCTMALPLAGLAAVALHWPTLRRPTQ
jgi:MFS family permease